MSQSQQQLYFGNVALNRERDRNIAFYGRVSTQHEEQVDALGNQMQWYDDQLRYHQNWNVVGRYIDEGITGTSTKKRPAFMNMLEDAKQGKFDLIVTREVCRFARNTVDTLMITRELRNNGVEVYFVNDNIWTMDGDGELRLSIMATIAQEESRKISERVLAGQMVSRQKGVLYGSGNIIGYDRVNGTYVINPEQAFTIRTVYELYAKGLGEKSIVNELSRMGCKDGAGRVNWSAPKISRILRNATYMGYICYNKSKINNYLEKKRINNLDEDSIIKIKGNFEPIVSEELWHTCEKIRKNRIVAYNMPSGEERRKGTLNSKYLWCTKLLCRCGSSFRRYHWRTLANDSPVYGYQCAKRTHAPALTFSLEHGLTEQIVCDARSIPQWKLELMAKYIFQAIWGDQKEAVLKACELICTARQKLEQRNTATTLFADAQVNKIKERKLRYSQMYADGDLSREEYTTLCSQVERDLAFYKNQNESQTSSNASNKASYDLQQIRKALDNLIDLSTPCIDDALIDRFVEIVTPVDQYSYRWKLNFTQKSNRYTAPCKNIADIEHPPLLKITITFEMAKKYREENHMPVQFRKRAWHDLTVEVFA
jgi:DNA invertase Pin-like site-specific DNA recombinase